jgi:hypothetical protein
MKLISGIEVYLSGTIKPIFEKESVLVSETKTKFMPSIFNLFLCNSKLKVSLDINPHLIFSWPSKNA